MLSIVYEQQCVLQAVRGVDHAADVPYDHLVKLGHAMVHSSPKHAVIVAVVVSFGRCRFSLEPQEGYQVCWDL